jgi:hypothetical protein
LRIPAKNKSGVVVEDHLFLSPLTSSLPSLIDMAHSHSRFSSDDGEISKRYGVLGRNDLRNEAERDTVPKQGCVAKDYRSIAGLEYAKCCCNNIRGKS